MYRHILVTLDSCEYSEAFLTRIIYLAQPLGSTVHLLCVFPPCRAKLSRACSTDRQQAREHRTMQYLRQVATRFRSAGLFVSMDVRCGEAAETILATAREVGAELIAMTTAWEEQVDSVATSTVVEQVMRRAAVTVMVDQVRYATVATV